MSKELFKNLSDTETAATTEVKKPEETAPEVSTAPEEDTSPSGSSEADEASNDPQMPDELTMLKDRARLMGIAFSNNIGLETLKAKIEEHKTKTEAQPKKAEDSPEKTARTTARNKKVSLRTHLQKEKMKLVRLRITNLDPKKKDLPGEILTVANEYLGTVRKFVPYGEVTDNGYHVPYCLYEFMRDRKFISIKTRKDPRGNTIVEHQWVREYALEMLPPLTAEELAKLSAAQQAAGGLSK